MNKYQCQVCGAVSYSAASQENLKDNSCLECDGRVEMVEGDKMNADEIVRALRICNRPKGHRCSECPVFSRYEHRICKATVDRHAADLIESLQAQLEQKTNEAEGMRSNWYKCIENLKESQRRERAAVTEVGRMAEYIVTLGRVDYFLCDKIPKDLHLKHQPKNDGNYDNAPCIKCVAEYFMSGPQTEKGETHE